MTEPVDTWIGCLVLIVAPEPLSEPVREAVGQVEQVIYNDPVYADAARVAAPRVDDLLGGDLDAIEFTLYRELVLWGASPARNPAPRATFCVLVVHWDPREADQVINALASTPRLGDLPVVFRTALVDAPSAEDSMADRGRELVPVIIDAIDATAHEIDKTPDFSLDVDRLSRMAVDTPVVPPPSAPEHHVDVLPLDEFAWEGIAAEANEEAVPAPEPAPSAEQGDPEEEGRKRSFINLVPNAVLDRSRELIARRKLPNTGVDVIKGLSRQTDRVLLLYAVFVSEPVKPPRTKRRARTDFAYALTRTMLSVNYDANRDHWYVRALNAGKRVRPGRPLPTPELLRHRDFPDQWGEHFDLFDAVGELSEIIERDRSSFRRRGVDAVWTAVVFVAGSVPHVSEDTRTRLTVLRSAGVVVWVYFGRSNAADGDRERLGSAGVHVLEHHEDIVDELQQLVEPPPSTEDEERLAEVSPEPLMSGER